MKKFIYTNKIDKQIISHENQMLELYVEKINKFASIFEQKGCSLKVGLMWGSFLTNIVKFQREKFQNGYQCYVYCTVQKGGRDVYISSNDGEAEYYPLSTTWMISSIFRRFYKLKATLYSDTSDVEDELNDMLLKLK